MDRFPFGISRLDEMIGGGAPSGSTVLLVSEIGAGGRDFLYTSVVMNGLLRSEDSQFDFYYGDLHPQARVPESIQYLSFTDAKEAVIEEMEFTMGPEIVSAGADAIEFRDLSREYFRRSHVPSEWYSERTTDIATLGKSEGYSDVYEAIGDHLSTTAPNSIIALDSVTDLFTISDEDMDWEDITLLMKGLRKVVHRRGGLLLLLVNKETLTDMQLGGLMEPADGTIMFQWASGGTKRDRVMFVREFRGVLSRLEEEDVIQFETEITDSGFDISDVRKIR